MILSFQGRRQRDNRPTAPLPYIRNKIDTSLKDEVIKNEHKENFMTVPAAIKELEKIEMIRQLDGKYRLDHALEELKRLLDKKDEQKKTELISVIDDCGMSYDEIIDRLKSKSKQAGFT